MDSVFVIKMSSVVTIGEYLHAHDEYVVQFSVQSISSKIAPIKMSSVITIGGYLHAHD